MENKRKPEERAAFGRIRIRKTDADDKDLRLSGAWFEAVCVQTGEKTVFATGEDGIALSPELSIGYLDHGAWIMYEYTVRELMPPPGYGRCEETFSVVFDREKEDLIQLYELSVENKTTRAGFSKLDLTTGEELPGASLELKTSDGRLVDSWISGKTPHLVEGKLTAGENYILTEISAPDGYELAESISFTVPENGNFVKIEMTDRRKPPEEPETPTEPEQPTEPDIPDFSGNTDGTGNAGDARKHQRSRNVRRHLFLVRSQRNRWKRSGQSLRQNRNRNGKKHMGRSRYAMNGNFQAAERGTSTKKAGQISEPRKREIREDQSLQ